MTRIRGLITTAISMLLVATITACSGGGGGSAPIILPGAMTVSVVDGSVSPAAPIGSAYILVIDPDTGSPIDTLTTGIDGNITGSYFNNSVQLKVSAQGYTSSPANSGMPPLPVSLVAGGATSITVTLYPLDPSLALGTITGTVRDYLNLPLAGALVVANGGSSTMATTSDRYGNYLIYNVPAGSVDVTAWKSGYNFPTLSGNTLLDGETLVGMDVTASGLATGSVSGHVSFTAVSGDIIDVTMLEPGSREVIPGLRSYTDTNASYNIIGVPNGTFEIIASLENDGYVIDPDTSVTQGIPVVTINNDSITQDLKATGSISLITPEAVINGVVPELPATPTFSWLKDSSYASADDYVVELVDESSATIWGGFGPAPTFVPVRTVPQGNNPSVIYDGPALEAGHVYQLRVYARSLDGSPDTGYTLLSASETLDGLFRVAAP